MVSHVVLLDAGPLGLATNPKPKTFAAQLGLFGMAAIVDLSLGVDDCVVATTNVGHWSHFAAAQLWNEIEPPAAD